MTLLFILWATALAVIVVSLLAGIVLSTRQGVATRSGSLSDLFSDELRALSTWMSNAVLRVIPLWKRSVAAVSYRSVLLRDHSMRWVFGKTEQERGKTSSFFLKHLAEHQDALRQGTEEKHGY